MLFNSSNRNISLYKVYLLDFICSRSLLYISRTGKRRKTHERWDGSIKQRDPNSNKQLYKQRAIADPHQEDTALAYRPSLKYFSVVIGTASALPLLLSALGEKKKKKVSPRIVNREQRGYKLHGTCHEHAKGRMTTKPALITEELPEHCAASLESGAQAAWGGLIKQQKHSLG